MALDQASVAWLEQARESGFPPVYELTPAQARENSATLRRQRQPGPGPELARVEEARVPVSGGSVPVRILVPPGQPRAVIVYYHGGGWVLGSIDESDLLGRTLAERTGCAVVLVGYRLAPEYRFPTAVDDSQAALDWTVTHLTDIAGAPVPVVVAGDSAGGNLSAVLARRARSRGGPPISLQVLVYPVTDCDLSTTSYTDPANQLILSAQSMVWFWDHYAPEEVARMHPDASPLRAPDVSHLPPAVIITAEHDVLRDEGELYATRLVKAGVPVVFRRFDGQMHGFFTQVGILTATDEAIDFIAAGIKDHLAAAGG
ncbi:MAG TPA: alpha/beta hydrolase [Streptosporangiaceae bacterium]|jgi:acetyl esterase|nr:alpha/beta hydrolase [Streptosporangiaceae bacterium]